ncbi:hypothetical protein KQR57_05360 [Bacillus inaquosorum]|nr:hypothetical protein [Bacillus inaquosorum]
MPQHQEDMAIIGIASRFPDAPNKEEYWELLKQEKRPYALYRKHAGPLKMAGGPMGLDYGY